MSRSINITTVNMAKMFILRSKIRNSWGLYKVLALDLDGTVLNSHHGISRVLRDKIHTLKESVHVVLVTGRHHTTAKPYYYELGLDTPIICCNGTYVFDYVKAGVVQHNAISKANAREFIRIAEANHCKLVMYIKDAMLYSRDRQITYMERLTEWATGYNGDMRPDIRRVDSFLDELDLTEHVWKFVIEGEESHNFNEFDFIRNNFSGERSWVDRTDYSSIGNNKGRALAQYVEQLGFTAEQVVAIGDNHNDISMIEYAGLGVAMQNADSAVKRAAELTTSASNDDDNVLAELLGKLF